MQISEYMKNTARGTIQGSNNFGKIATITEPIQGSNYFPITEDAFPSMDAQLKTGQLRNKIENEQQEALIQQ